MGSAVWIRVHGGNSHILCEVGDGRRVELANRNTMCLTEQTTRAYERILDVVGSV